MLTDEHEHAMKVWREAYGAYVATSIKAAAAVIAADRAGLVAEIERLREAVGILEDGLQEVGDDYPGSSCQEWCQHQIKQARAALKDTRNDADA